MIFLDAVVELSIHVAVGQTFKVHMFQWPEYALLEGHVVHLFQLFADSVALVDYFLFDASDIFIEMLVSIFVVVVEDVAALQTHYL